MNLMIGVTGGVAAYKACEIVSLARKRGWQVRVAMTESATRFVGPITFEALSGSPVFLDTFGGASGDIDHIEWARWPDVACVAPLTANMLSKLACGIADDGLSTVLMALPRGTPCALAPAMNTEMWMHPVIQRNLRWIKQMDRYHLVDPVVKRLACGDVGAGALADPSEIIEVLARLVAASTQGGAGGVRGEV